ncbi:MAG: cobyrinate a,c-diamide synthase [Pseudomonadota bacterium]
MSAGCAMAAPGLILAAPASGAGKTTLTLALLRRLVRDGVRVAAAKAGPDYIDPGFHAAASGRPCLNLDPWAMRAESLAALVARLAEAELVLVEGVMGLFDGIDAKGTGSTADLAQLTGWPVVLAVDARGQAASAAAVVEGFARYRAGVDVAGVIFNRVGGEGHARLLRQAMAARRANIPVLGCVGDDPSLALPERHLGLVQARERLGLEAFLDRAAERIGAAVDLAQLRALARPARMVEAAGTAVLVPPLGSRIAVAADDAFAFAYPALLDGWRRAGAELSFFSPLNDEAPDTAADAVYLPGGYPELHAARISGGRRFVGGLGDAARRGAAIYGECGGYMVLGRTLCDAEGRDHAMAGLLALESSCERPRLHLGYRRAALAAAGPLGPAGTAFRGHEFHYATILSEGEGEPLFRLADAGGAKLADAGRRAGSVMGSFVHLIDRA